MSDNIVHQTATITKIYERTLRYLPLINEFFKLEKLDFEGIRDSDLDNTKAEILILIDEMGVDHVRIDSITNLGQLSRSIVIDMFDSDHWMNGKINITLCPCGKSWSAKQKDQVLKSLDC